MPQSSLAFDQCLCRWHQQGPVAAAAYIAQAAVSSRESMRVHFWTPCHATPYYSQIHSKIELWFPDCSPDARLSTNGCESDLLRKSPVEFLDAHYTQRKLPTHVVLFQNMEARVRPWLQMHGFAQDARLFHQHFSGDRDDPESNEYIFIFKLSNPPKL